jgi:16S rRNA (guanine966-N2)-methyltransferase
MRVTGGTGRGRRLKAPAGSRVRPTSDKVKQALFNILGERVVDALFLDLFAGAGSIGIEALSRGAGRVVFVDQSRSSLRVLEENIKQTGFTERSQTVLSKAGSFLKKPSGTYDVVYLDPPYADELQPLLELIAEAKILGPGSVLIAEHFKKQLSPASAGDLMLYREAKYGDTVLAFYSLRRQEPEVRSKSRC